MLRAFVALAVLVALSDVALADEPVATPDDVAEIARRVQFDMLVLKGNQERAKSHLVDAANAYADALHISRDPLIAGRLGVLLVQLGKLADAADLLADALQRDTEASPEERLAFLRAYDKAKAEGGWLEVVMSHVGTNLTLDNAARNKQGHSTVLVFVLAGDHELRATLEGYKDAYAQVTVRKGDKVRRVPLTLEALPDPLPKVEALRRKRSTLPVQSAEDPPDEPDKPTIIYGGVEGGPRPEKPRISVAGGPVVVFGVASWQPAIGAVAEVRWKPKDYFSLGIEGRAAWLTSGLAGAPINTMTAGAIATGCLHWRWAHGCALGHLGVITITGEKGTFLPQSNSYLVPGLGGRIGVKSSLGSGFAMGASLDAMGLNRGIKVIAGQTELVNHPPIMLGAQIVGGWEF